jgi:predicted lipoprotein with Yx(FWY)xxD motif
MKRLLATLTLVVALTLAACGDSDDDAAPEPTQPTKTSQTKEPPDAEAPAKKDKEPKPNPSGTKIAVGESQFGPILFDDSDQVVYLFDKETSSKPECYGDCAAEWPPVLTKGEPVAGDGAKQGLLGSTKRDDGSTQVTYAGQPLYYYAHEGPGAVLCHNVTGFGGLWLVLDGAGDALS